MPERRPHALLAGLIAGRRRAAIAVAVTLVGVGVYVGSSALDSGEIQANGGNLWIDANGGECGRNAKPARYDDGAACGSAQAAYEAASCGDTVRIKAGAGYGSLTISSGTKSCSRDSMIVFRPEDDRRNRLAEQSSVVVSQIDIQVSDCWCEVRDIDTFAGADTDGTVRVDAGDAAPAPAHVVLRRIDTRTIWLPARDVEIHGGSAGGFNACVDGDGGLQDAVQIWQAGDPPRPPGDIVVDGLYVHDMGETASCDDHSDAIQILCGTDITIRNVTVAGGPDEDIIGRPFKCPLERVLVENNMFGATGGTQNIVMGSGDVCSNIVIRNNSATESINLSCSEGGSGNRHYNNIASSCIIENATSSNNVRTNAKGSCGTGARACSPAYTDANHAATGDKHLAPSDTCARGMGRPSDLPERDVDGDSRPQGDPDIGADEIG